MNLRNIIREISNREEIQQQPPILIDIGASYGINNLWKTIAPFSICLAFDADDREFEYLEENNSIFKKLIKFNKIVVHKSESETMDFYLTESPYCSSLLEPQTQSLANFHYSSFFKVVEKKKMGVVELPEILKKTGIDYIDWFKSDSQGTDLRLFKSLDKSITDKTIIIETEPGFIDAYKQEDKIADLLHYMEANKNFFLTEFKVKGPLRIPQNLFRNIYRTSLYSKIAGHTLKIVPGWAEVTYMNSFENIDVTLREFMIAWLFSTLKGHHEIAYVYAYNAIEKYGNDDFWSRLITYSEKKLKWKIFSPESAMKLITLVYNKYFVNNRTPYMRK